LESAAAAFSVVSCVDCCVGYLDLPSGGVNYGKETRCVTNDKRVAL